jgi:hypothetical protein
MGNIDVEIETVFAADGSVVTIPFAEFRLRAGCAICIGVANAAPVPGGNRRVPAKITQRWFGVSNAEELRASTCMGNAAKLTGGCRDDEGISGCFGETGCDERGGQDEEYAEAEESRRRNRNPGCGRCEENFP